MWWPARQRAVNECLAARNIHVPVYNIGLPDRFVGQGERNELLAQCGLDVEGVLRQLTDWGIKYPVSPRFDS